MHFRRAVAEVERAATAAAREVVSDPMLVREAVEAAVEKFEDAFLQKKVVSHPGAWGRRVGRHEAVRIAKRRKLVRPEGADLPEAAVRLEPSRQLPPIWQVRAALRGPRKKLLTPKQREAVEAVLEHGSYTAAAKALGKDTAGVSRLFRRALERLTLKKE